MCLGCGNGTCLRNHNERTLIRSNETRQAGANGIVLANGAHTIYKNASAARGTPHHVFNEITNNTIHHIKLMDIHLWVCDHCCCDVFAAVICRNIFYDDRDRASLCYGLAERDQLPKICMQCDDNLFFKKGMVDPEIVAVYRSLTRQRRTVRYNTPATSTRSSPRRCSWMRRTVTTG